MEMDVPTIIIIIFISPFFFIAICHTEPLSFNYTNLDQCSDSIKLFDSAVCVDSGLQLTGFEYYKTGQAHYSKPMRLWDSSTGKLTNFTTTFTFSMDNNNSTYACDGLAFFIASSNYSTTQGSDGLLGLVNGNHTFNSTQNPFVAVEFDTYRNPDWDTWSGSSHVGIDVNSIKSVASKRWRSYSNGTTMSAQISYKAGNLCAQFTGLTEEMVDVLEDTLCYEVDFKDYLTEWAVFGFSASTAFRYQSHTVKTWSFSSGLDSERGSTMVKQGVNKSNTNTQTMREDSKPKKTNKTLIIGLVLGIIGAVTIILVVGTMIWARSNKRPGRHLRSESGRRNPEGFLRARAERPSG